MIFVFQGLNQGSWGIELPFDKDYVTYVWFDALINYLTGIGFKKDKKPFEKYWPASYHLIGKDILTTHAIYWPTMLMSLEIDLPKLYLLMVGGLLVNLK